MGPVSSVLGSQSGLPVGKEPSGGSRSAAEMGPVSSVLGSQSGLPDGKEPSGGSRSAAEMGPVSSVEGPDAPWGCYRDLQEFRADDVDIERGCS
jgi:hypothetical protein